MGWKKVEANFAKVFLALFPFKMQLSADMQLKGETTEKHYYTAFILNRGISISSGNRL